MTFKTECPGCGQRVASGAALKNVVCPNCGVGFVPRWQRPAGYWVRVGVIIAGTVLICGWILVGKYSSVMDTYGGRESGLGAASEYESKAARLTRLRSEAAAAVRASCTNEVGFLRVVSVSTLTSADNPNQWTATADIDVVTGAVGVARKKLMFQGCQLMGAILFSKVSEVVSAER